MLILSLCWLLVGMLIGALANAAKLRPAAWGRGGRPGMLALAALAALLGGWLGSLLIGALFATATATCVGVLAVTLLPRLITCCAGWLRRGGRSRVSQRRKLGQGPGNI